VACGLDNPCPWELRDSRLSPLDHRCGKRFLRNFLYLGLNQDERGRRVLLLEKSRKPGVKILPVRQTTGTDGTAQTLADGIRAGVDGGATVINVSITVAAPSPVLEGAVHARIGSEEQLCSEVLAWEQRRNQEHRRIDWKFTRQDADRKLSRHYVT